jgi:hypothetical protein
MCLTCYVHLDGIKRSDWLQECTEWQASTSLNNQVDIILYLKVTDKLGHVLRFKF